MKFDFKKNILPHILIILSFHLVLVFYFSDHFMKGETIKQDDIVSYRGMAKESMDFRKENPGETAFWINNMFSGMPNYMIDVDYNQYNYVHFVRNILNPFGIDHPVKLSLVGLLCMYVLLLSLRVNKYIAAIGAFAYTFGSFFFISFQAGHTSKIEAMYLACLVLAGVIYIYERKNQTS